MEHEWVKWAMAPVAAMSAFCEVHAVEYLSVEQAQVLMFGKEADFARSDLVFDSAARSAITIASGVRFQRDRQPVWKVRRKHEFVGYFIVDEVVGKHQFITYAVGLEPEGRVLRLEILVYREHYGYEVQNPAWTAQFIGQKPGENYRLDKEIKNISGATLSCQHLTEGVNRLLATYEYFLRHGKAGKQLRNRN